MAITITTQPNGSILHLAYNPILYQFSSDTTDIQYCIVEVLADGVRISATSVTPDLGTTDEFTLDISSIVQTHLSNSLNAIGSNGFNFANNGKESFKLKIYEAYLNVSSELTTAYNPDDANNSSYDFQTVDIVGVNWAVDYIDRQGLDITNYEFSDSRSGTKFLTTSPLTKEIEANQNEFLGIGSYVATGIKGYSLEILTYDSSDALLNTDTIALTEWNTGYASLHSVIDDIYIDVAIGTQNLINEGISLTNVAYYTVKMINTSGDRSETRRFNIVSSCGDDVRLHWFNKFGKQESMTFKGNIVETLTNSSTSYEKALPVAYSSENRGTSTIQNIRSNNFTAYSKSIGRETYYHALSILDNNMAFIEIDGNYFPITIDDVSVVKRDEQDMPIQFALKYRYSNRDKGLRG